jgi:preprotein translocase subunit SecG
MSVLFFILKIFHYLTCIGLVIIIFLQAGKNGVIMGRGIFTSGGSDQIFNAPSGIAFINKLTIFIACVFLSASLLLARLSLSMNMRSVVNNTSNFSANHAQPVRK